MKKYPHWIHLLIIVFALLSFSVFPKNIIELINDPQTRVATDFNPYLTGGILLRQNQGNFLYNIIESEKIQAALSAPHLTPRIPYRAIPFTALFYVPFSFLPFDISYSLFMIVSFLLIGAIFLYLKFIFFKQVYSLYYWLFVFSFTPTLVGILQGQPTIILFCGLALSLIYFSQRKFFQAGIFLSLLFIKPHILLPILILLTISRKPKFVFGTITGIAIITFVSTILVGLPTISTYPQYLALTENPSFGTQAEGLSSIFVSLPKILIVPTIIGILFVIQNLYSQKYFENSNSLKLFSFVSLLGLTLSYHTGHHDLSLLSIPILYFLSTKQYLYGSLLYFVTLPYWVSPIMTIRPFIYLFIALTQIPIFFPHQPSLKS